MHISVHMYTYICTFSEMVEFVQVLNSKGCPELVRPRLIPCHAGDFGIQSWAQSWPRQRRFGPGTYCARRRTVDDFATGI